MKYLDYLDKSAKDIGCVNTVVNENGRLCGYNTDVLGLQALLENNEIYRDVYESQTGGSGDFDEGGEQ